MSQENVEIVRAALDAANRNDWDSMFEKVTPDFELDFSRATGPVLHGVLSLDQVRRGLVEFAGTWESVRFEPHEFIESDDLVVVPYSVHLEGRDGIEVVSRPTTVWTVRAGAIERVVMYQERQTPSKTWASRSKTLTPTPEPAGYWAGDVAGERGDRAGLVCVPPRPARHRSERGSGLYRPRLPRVSRRGLGASPAHRLPGGPADIPWPGRSRRARRNAPRRLGRVAL